MSILSGLDTAQRALYSQQLGLEIAQRNVANANTPGYTKLRLSFEPATTNGADSAQAGAGIAGVTIDSFRNNFVDYRLNQELQGQGEQQAASDALQQVEALFSDQGGLSLQGALSNFFNSFATLANTPEDISQRQQVLAAAEKLTGQFHRLYDQIQAIQSQQNRVVPDTVEEINSVTSQIARLNKQMVGLTNGHSVEESAARDERQQLLDHLSGLVDISYYEDSLGLVTVQTKQGALLVAGTQSKTLETGPSPVTGFQNIFQDGVDITSRIQSGKLAGLIKVRDVTIPAYLNSLDDMAAALITSVNDQHKIGFALNGDQGGDFFTPFVPPALGSNAGAARSFSVAIADHPTLIAAAGPSAGDPNLAAGPGSNANAQLLAGIKDDPLPTLGETPDQYYSNVIFQIGSDSQSAYDGLQTQNNIVQQLLNQRDTFSGVSLDEEAVNIIKYQKAYQASARFVTVLDTLSDEILRILGG